jgi:hypothetical protein
VGPYHHGMARPRVADGGDGLQILRIAANMLNKHSQTADLSGGPTAQGLCEGLSLLRNVTQDLRKVGLL